MKVQYSRQVQGGFGTARTETKIEELPDKDGNGNDTPVPADAVKVDDGMEVHDWQGTLHGMPGGLS